MPSAFDPRKKPIDVKVHVSNGTGVDIVWTDGHSSHYDFAYLREECPCAMCNDERSKKRRFSETAAGGSSAVLPMFKPRPGARSAKPVGHYALQMDFTDGHTTGIYSYDYLRTICPCAECVKLFRSSNG
jgi:DUF971 family protein